MRILALVVFVLCGLLAASAIETGRRMRPVVRYVFLIGLVWSAFYIWTHLS